MTLATVGDRRVLEIELVAFAARRRCAPATPSAAAPRRAGAAEIAGRPRALAAPEPVRAASAAVKRGNRSIARTLSKTSGTRGRVRGRLQAALHGRERAARDRRAPQHRAPRREPAPLTTHASTPLRHDEPLALSAGQNSADYQLERTSKLTTACFNDEFAVKYGNIREHERSLCQCPTDGVDDSGYYGRICADTCRIANLHYWRSHRRNSMLPRRARPSESLARPVGSRASFRPTISPTRSRASTAAARRACRN